MKYFQVMALLIASMIVLGCSKEPSKTIEATPTPIKAERLSQVNKIYVQAGKYEVEKKYKEALDLYKEIVNQYPESDIATKAIDKIVKLKEVSNQYSVDEPAIKIGFVDLPQESLSKVKDETTTYGKKNNFTIIFDAREILYGADEINITDKINSITSSPQIKQKNSDKRSGSTDICYDLCFNPGGDLGLERIATLGCDCTKYGLSSTLNKEAEERAAAPSRIACTSACNLVSDSRGCTNSCERKYCRRICKFDDDPEFCKDECDKRYP